MNNKFDEIPFDDSSAAEENYEKQELENVNEISELHKNISKGKLEKIKKFIEKYPNLKLCYGNSKVCALEKSIDCNNFKIYSFLLANGFYTDKQSELDAKIEELDEDEKIEIRDENLKLSIGSDENFINILMQKCKLSSTSGSASFEEVRKMLKDLSKIPELKIILQVIAHADVKIFIDYSCSSTFKVDPTTDSGTTGIAYFSKGIIIIGTDSSLNARYGTFSHECTHQVLVFVYDNDCLPYCEGDTNRQNEWNEIVENIKRSFSENPHNHDEIIRWVFMNYKAGFEQQAELAVRVNHMLAHHRDNPERVHQIENQYADLFRFYRQRIQPDLMIPDGIQLRKLNKDIGLLEKIKNSPIKLKIEKKSEVLRKNGGKKRFLIRSNLPIIALRQFHAEIFENEDNKLNSMTRNIFLDCKALSQLNLMKEFNKLKNSPTISRIIIKIDQNFDELEGFEFDEKIDERIEKFDEITEKFYERIEKFDERIEKFDERIEKFDERIEKFDERIEKFDERIEKFDERIEKFDERIEKFDERIEKIDEIIEKFDERIEKFDERIEYFIFVSNDINDEKNLFKSQNVINMNFDLNQLTTATQSLILQTKIHFQSHEIQLRKIFSINTKNIPQDAIIEILSDNKSSINADNCKDEDEFYIPRRFQKNEKIEDEEYANLGYDQRVLLKSKSEAEKIDLDALLDAVKDDKIVLISDSAGAGKTSTLKHIKNLLIKQHKTHWISFVNLKEHIDEFSDYKNQEFHKFMCENILSLKNSLEKSTFIELYEKNKGIFLFDGFDEISPHCKETVMSLITKFLENPSCQLWITTRTHLEEDLEKKFKIESFSITELTKNEQIQFLISFWSRQTQDNLKMDEIKKFAVEMIDELSKIMNNTSSNLIGLPLQVRMIGSIYESKLMENSTEKFKIDLNFLQIYQEFIKIKKKIWMHERGELAKQSSEKSQENSLNFIQIHEYIALQYFLNDQNDIFGIIFDMFGLQYDEDEWPIEEIARCGIIRVDKDSNLYFIHETFAEYLVANFIIKNLNSKWKYSDEISKIFIRVLTDNKFLIIRLFLNDGISEITNNELKFNIGIKHLLLYYLAVEGHLDLIFIILKYISNCGDEFFRNFLMNSCMKSGNFFLVTASVLNSRNELKFMEIFNIIASNFTRKLSKQQVKPKQEVKPKKGWRKFLSKRKFFAKMKSRSDGSNFMAILNENSRNIEYSFIPYLLNSSISSPLLNEIFDKILEISKRKLKENIVELLFNFYFLHFNLLLNKIKPDNMKIFMDLLKRILNRKELLNFCRMKDMMGNSLLHCLIFASNDSSIILFDFIIDTLSVPAEQMKIINEKSFNYSNFIYLTASQASMEFFKHLWNRITQILTDKVLQKEFLFLEGKHGETVLQLAAENEKENIFKFVFNLVRSYCDSNHEFKRIITENSSRISILILNIFENGNIDNLKYFWTELQNIFTRYEIKDILKRQTPYGNLLTFTTFSNVNQTVLEFLWQLLEDYLDKSELLEMIYDNQNVDNFFHQSVNYCTKDIVELNWNKLKKIFDNCETEKGFLQIRGSLNEDALKKSKNNKVDVKVYPYCKDIYSEYFT